MLENFTSGFYRRSLQGCVTLSPNSFYGGTGLSKNEKATNIPVCWTGASAERFESGKRDGVRRRGGALISSWHRCHSCVGSSDWT